MDIESEILHVWPDCERTQLGDYPVFIHADSVPAHDYCSVLRVLDGDRAVELVARDSYDPILAEELLTQSDRIYASHFGQESLAVFPHKFADPYTFNCTVFAPPSVAQRFETQSEPLNEITGWFFPAYEGEFDEGESARDFWHQINRKDDDQIHIVRWDRHPWWTRIQSFARPGPKVIWDGEKYRIQQPPGHPGADN